MREGHRGARPSKIRVTTCVDACTCMLACVRVGEVTPEDNPGEGKHKNKPQTNSSIFVPTNDMMASNRSMHTNSKCQKVCICFVFVTENVLVFLSLG